MSAASGISSGRAFLPRFDLFGTAGFAAGFAALFADGADDDESSLGRGLAEAAAGVVWLAAALGETSSMTGDALFAFAADAALAVPFTADLFCFVCRSRNESGASSIIRFMRASSSSSTVGFAPGKCEQPATTSAVAIHEIAHWARDRLRAA